MTKVFHSRSKVTLGPINCFPSVRLLRFLLVAGISVTIIWSSIITQDIDRKEMFAVSDLDPDGEADGISFLRSLPRDVLFVEPFHGLGNRLRAVACAAALAEKTNRTLVIVWLPDHHINATMGALFDINNLTVIDFQVSHLLRRVWTDVKYFDYNARGGKDEVLPDSFPGPLYVRSAYVLQSRTRVSERELTAQLLNLVPSKKVMLHFESLQSIFKPESEVIGVHIRMITNIEQDVPGISKLPDQDPAGVSNMGPVASLRSRCHFDYFIPHMQAALQRRPGAVFFISSDSYEAIRGLRARFGDRVLSNTFQAYEVCNGKFRRWTTCVQTFLAELLFLGTKSSELIISDWSSASELAVRFSAWQTSFTSGCQERKVSWFG